MKNEKPSADVGQWAPVVYGRTLNADVWWRALPDALDRHDSDAAVVLAAVGGGRGLSRSPRFALVRRRTGTLVGVACMARHLGTVMNADRGGRPLFCFLGWYAQDARAEVPQLYDVEAGWVRWAQEQYERWMQPVWEAHQGKLREPAHTSPEAPPWQALGKSRFEPPDVSADSGYAMLSPAPGKVRVHSSAGRAWVWQGVATYGRDTALVTGWASYRDAVLNGVTDVCADDITQGRLYLVPAPTPERRVDASFQEASFREGAPRHAAPPVAGHPHPSAPVAAVPPHPADYGKQSSGPGRKHWDPWNLDVLKIRDRAERLLRGDAGRDLPPPPAPPPPPGTPDEWIYEQRYHAFYSTAGGLLTCWNGYQLFRWDRDHWVEQTALPDAEGNMPSGGEPATGERHAQGPRDARRKDTGVTPGTSEPVPPVPVINPQKPSAETIEQTLSAGFGDFEKAPLPQQPFQPADDKYNSSGESAEESADS